MLITQIMLPEEPDNNQLQVEDILIKVNNKLLTQLVFLNAILNSSVGQIIHLLVQWG
jgi:pro-apoptotic serine protease NMA111